MSSDLREFTEFFRDCVDELNVLQKRADERAEARADNLAKVAKDCLSANTQQMNKFCFEMERGVDTVESVEGAAKQLNEYLHFCAIHVKLALFLFFGSLILAGCIWVSTYFWYKHVSDQVVEARAEVAEARLELTQANAKLKNKPLFLPGNSGVGGNQSDYVRVVPNTEEEMSHADGEPYPGVYAKVWHK